jgi:hypothetical protein
MDVGLGWPRFKGYFDDKIAKVGRCGQGLTSFGFGRGPRANKFLERDQLAKKKKNYLNFFFLVIWVGPRSGYGFFFFFL